MNAHLQNLLDVLGEEETRILVRLFLETSPKLLQDMQSDDSHRALRAAHTLKSSTQQMGCSELSQAADALEKRLHAQGGLPSPEERARILALYRDAEISLRGFAGA